MDEEVKNEVTVEAVEEKSEETKTQEVNKPLADKKVDHLGLFAMSLLSIILPGVVGIILGIIALVKTNKLRHEEEVAGLMSASFVMSIVGIVCSVLTIICFAVGFGFVLSALDDLLDMLFYYSYWWF